MVSIHGAVFIVIGLLVVVFSYFRDILFFKIVGVLFIVYGTFKWIFKAITGANTAKEALNMNAPEQKPLRNAAQPSQPYSSQDISRRQMYKCRKCGNDIFLHNQFCSNCGLKLR